MMKKILPILLSFLAIQASAVTIEKRIDWAHLAYRLATGQSPYFTVYTYSVTDGISQNGHTGGYFVINADAAHHSVGGATQNLNLVPGDVVQFHGGQYWSIEFDWLQGFYGNQITIQNVDGETVWLGDKLWGATYTSWEFGLKFLNCQHFKVWGTHFGQFILTGSTVGGFTATGVNQSYSNIICRQFTNHAEIANLWVRGGGHGVVFKTEPEAGVPNTWDNSQTVKVVGWYIHDNRFDSTADEGIYGGHTSTYWDFSCNCPYYPADTIAGNAVDTTSRKRALKNDSVHIAHNLFKACRIDGIQTAASDHVEIDHNEVNGWAYVRVGNVNAVDIGGIIDGGRNTNVSIHDNIVHDGYGDMFQLFGEGWNHTFYNNLGYNTVYGEAISIRSTAGTVPAVYSITNNTLSQFASHGLRVNYAFGTRGPVIASDNLIIQPGGQYVYLENGGTITEARNHKFATLAAANVDVSCYYTPLNPSETAGYRSGISCGIGSVIKNFHVRHLNRRVKFF